MTSEPSGKTKRVARRDKSRDCHQVVPVTPRDCSAVRNRPAAQKLDRSIVAILIPVYIGYGFSYNIFYSMSST
jgi:hypothetical protein